MTQCIDRYFAHVEIFADSAVLGDITFDFISHAFVDRPLSGNRCLSRGLSTATSFLKLSTTARLELAHLSGKFTFGQLPARSLLQLGDVGGLLPGQPLALGTQLTLGHAASATASRNAFAASARSSAGAG